MKLNNRKTKKIGEKKSEKAQSIKIDNKISPEITKKLTHTKTEEKMGI